MTISPGIDGPTLEALAKVLGECGSGPEINQALKELGFGDHPENETKWRKLLRVFVESQCLDGGTHRILKFIETLMAPVKFVHKSEKFERHRRDLNVVLAFVGLYLGDEGKIKTIDVAQTIPEAEARARRIEQKLQERNIHPEVLQYCCPELMSNNYFHAVFEATKGLAQQIREKSGTSGDGSALVDQVFFPANAPILALNSLCTETERSEHSGFAMLLKGCFSAIRNPLAHEPKILWDGEDDAADYLTLISLLQRKLDDCVRTDLGNRL